MEPTTFDLVIRSANVVALAGIAMTILKVAIPVGLSIRDSLHDTANELKSIRQTTEDHESRIRLLEHSPWRGEERRVAEERRS